MFQSMKYVYEVYKEMSFSKAAKNLYISQPSLSAAVKKIESEIGYPIFDRSTNPIGLTELGREYIRSAENIMNIEKGFYSYIEDMEDMKNGQITIGGTNFFISYVLPKLLLAFSEKYPQIKVNVTEGTTGQLFEKLQNGTVDLIMDNGNYDPENIGYKVMRNEHILLAVPKGFESNNAAAKYAFSAFDIKNDKHLEPGALTVPLSLFKSDPFLFLREGNSSRERADSICRRERFKPNIKLELDQQITAYNMSRHGLGISFIGDTLVKNSTSSEKLLFYKISGKEATREVCLFYKQNRYMSKAMQEFLKLTDEM